MRTRNYREKKTAKKIAHECQYENTLFGRTNQKQTETNGNKTRNNQTRRAHNHYDSRTTTERGVSAQRARAAVTAVCGEVNTGADSAPPRNKCTTLFCLWYVCKFDNNELHRNSNHG